MSKFFTHFYAILSYLIVTLFISLSTIVVSTQHCCEFIWLSYELKWLLCGASLTSSVLVVCTTFIPSFFPCGLSPPAVSCCLGVWVPVVPELGDSPCRLGETPLGSGAGRSRAGAVGEVGATVLVIRARRRCARLWSRPAATEPETLLICLFFQVGGSTGRDPY